MIAQARGKTFLQECYFLGLSLYFNKIQNVLKMELCKMNAFKTFLIIKWYLQMWHIFAIAIGWNKKGYFYRNCKDKQFEFMCRSVRLVICIRKVGQIYVVNEPKIV